MIRNEISPQRSRVFRTASMATCFRPYPVYFASFSSGKIALGAAGWDRISGKRTWTNSDSRKFTGTALRLLSLRIISADQSLDAFIRTRRRSPVGIQFPDTRRRILRPALRFKQPRRLPWLHLDNPSADPHGGRTTARSVLSKVVTNLRKVLICIGNDPRIVFRRKSLLHPPPALVAGLVGAEAGLAQHLRVPQHRNLKPQRRHMPFQPQRARAQNIRVHRHRPAKEKAAGTSRRLQMLHPSKGASRSSG